VIVRRILSVLVLLWAFGFIWFAALLPRPAAPVRSDAIVVPTGGAGRIDHAIALLRAHQARHVFVSGVDREVRPVEFALEYGVDSARMACCVTLGFDAIDTRSNAREIAAWVAREKPGTLRLVTSDWPMRRAAYELRRRLPKGFPVTEDGVRSNPSFRILFIEYHKLIAARLVGPFELD
jgi:uncharacterized SAM-binding protein YcdF (DUF218 family)